MRIAINYFEGYPELEAELTKYSPRARAERLRFLAALGLSFLRDGRSAHTTNVDEVSPQMATQPASGGGEVAQAITKNVFSQV